MDNNLVIVSVKDLGMAAYLKMKGYELVARRGREFDFKIKESDQDLFKQEQVEYVNSAFNTFDSEIMALKKLNG